MFKKLQAVVMGSTLNAAVEAIDSIATSLSEYASQKHDEIDRINAEIDKLMCRRSEAQAAAQRAARLSTALRKVA